MLYNEIKAASIGLMNNGLLLLLVFTKHYHFVCFRLSSHASVCFAHVSVCASVRLD